MQQRFQFEHTSSVSQENPPTPAHSQSRAEADEAPPQEKAAAAVLLKLLQQEERSLNKDTWIGWFGTIAFLIPTILMTIRDSPVKLSRAALVLLVCGYVGIAKVQEELKTAAQAYLHYLKTQDVQGHEDRQLLRGASRPADGETLLRPTQPGSETPPQELLRPQDTRSSSLP